MVVSSRLELNLLNGEDARERAIEAIEDSFRSLDPGKLRDLLGVTAALLEDTRRKPPATHLSVEVVRGRVRGDVDYEARSWVRSRIRGPQLANMVAGLRDRTAIVRSCGLKESRSGVWFDLGPA